MSTNIEAFNTKVQNSPELQQKVVTITQQIQHDLAERLAALSQEAGTPFTSEEFLSASTSRELSEAELEGVSGGVIPFIVAGMAGLVALGGYLVKDVEPTHAGRSR